MVGMIWRSWVILLVLFAWQVCSAQNLINLVESQVSAVAPYRIDRIIWPDAADDLAWKLFDRDDSTYAEVRDVEFEFTYAHQLAPTHYRIKMAPHVEPSDYPRRWRVHRGTRLSTSRVEVTGAKFKNGVYEAPLDFKTFRPNKYTSRFRLNFTWKRRTPKNFAIAEIELVGPREELDALWPFGNYPCAERFEILTSLDGPTGELFYAAKNDRAPEVLRAVFSPAQEPYEDSRGWRFEYGGDNKPVIILGAELPERPTVHEVAVDAFKIGDNGRVKKYVLQGHTCEPSCNNKLGHKGWVNLAKVRVQFQTYRHAPRLLLETPGTYKAYRIKFFPKYTRSGGLQSTGIFFRGIYFLGCTA